MRYEMRYEKRYENIELPSRYWEPQPDEEERKEIEERLQAEYERKLAAGVIEEEMELPFK